MAMDEYALTHGVKSTDILADDQHQFIVRACQVLPVPVKSRDSMSLESLWVIREADLVIDAISTKRVLSWLLQIDHDANIQVKHLRNDIVLLNLASAWSLRADNLVHDQI